MITVCSGAADTVGPPSIARHIPITQTWASLGGFCYTAANGDPLPNKGEKRVTGVTKEGEMVGLTMQVADVTKVLGSVGNFCEANNRVVFDDQEGSYIMNKDTGKKTMLVKSGGVYRFPMWVKKGNRRRAGSAERQMPRHSEDAQQVRGTHGMWYRHR